MSFFHNFKPVAVSLSVGAFLLGASTSALALDVAALTAGTLPAPNSVEESEVCAAVSSFGAYALLQGEQEALSEEDKQYQELVVNVAYAWVGLAADKAGVSDEDYMNNHLFPDMETAAGLENEIYMKHFGNCFERLVTLAEEAAASSASAGTTN